MRHGWRVLTGWGLGLVAIAAVEILFGPHPIEIALLGGAGAGTALVGLALLPRERAAPPGVEAAPAESVETVLAAVGFALFVLGWAVGAWMMGIGGGIFLVGLGALARELWQERA